MLNVFASSRMTKTCTLLSLVAIDSLSATNASEGRNFIETVWGRGYVLREPHDMDERIPA